MVDTFEALDAKLKLFIFKYIKTNIFFKFTIKNFIIFWGGKVEIVDLGLFSEKGSRFLVLLIKSFSTVNLLSRLMNFECTKLLSLAIKLFSVETVVKSAI